MMNAARIAEDLNAATESLSGERGAEASLAQALKKLSRLQEEARKRTAAAEAALEQAFAQTEEARRELDACCLAWTPTPMRWNARKSGCSHCAPWPANMASRPTSCPRCWRISGCS